MKKPDAERAPARPEGSSPEILVTYKPAGRETLDAIANELIPLPLQAERQSSSPEIIVHETEPNPLAALAEARSVELAEARSAETRPAIPVPPAAIVNVEPTPRSSPAGTAATTEARPAAQALEIFEMVTYVVRGGDVARLSSENARRAFVEERLLSRLPVRTMAEVERIDVTPWTVQGTLVVRVWCRTDAGR